MELATVLGYAIVAVLVVLALNCAGHFVLDFFRADRESTAGSLVCFFVLMLMAFGMAALTECTAEAQRIEIPWVTADTGSDWLDLLFVLVVVAFIAFVYLVVRVLSRGGR